MKKAEISRISRIVQRMTLSCELAGRFLSPARLLGSFHQGRCGRMPIGFSPGSREGVAEEYSRLDKYGTRNHLPVSIRKRRRLSIKARVVHRSPRRHAESAVATTESKLEFGSLAPTAARNLGVLSSPVRRHASSAARQEHRFCKMS